MKTLKNITIIALLIMAFSCKNETQPEVKTLAIETSENDIVETVDVNANYAKVKFNIDGMTCAMGCAKTIEKKMAKMEGVKSAKVDFENELAMVEYDSDKVTPKSLEDVVTKVGGGDVYMVKNMAKVDSFEEKAPCPEDCKKECCADKTAEQKMACAKDCNKACCKKEKA
ncbi:cation transporter [Winogradskyella sp. A3E31]|uniref:cation transporter n=1 Tax=Winogradskyella sp. A3E31 TaxID=3349637 RepID=UPI00398AEC0E